MTNSLSAKCSSPKCGHEFSLPASVWGSRIYCPACGAPSLAEMASSSETHHADDTVNRSASRSVTSGSRAASAPTMATRLGRFEIQNLLGQGAFGAVYRAFDPQLARQVALKVPQAGLMDSEPAITRFMQEAQTAAQLRHPHIVPVFDAGCEAGRYYIASAFIEGTTLAEQIRENRPTQRASVEIVRKLAAAIDYAHGLGIIHRDVKPANVMIDADGEPHLMDFGLARFEQSEEKLTQDGALLGTPAYMSPQQAEGLDLTPDADQYSLGVVLYELLAGEVPFSGPPSVVIFNVLNNPIPPLSSHLSVSRDLETICMKALAKEPESRYANCQELADDLERWLDEEPITARRQTVVERSWRWCRRNPLLAAMSSLAAVLLGVVVLVLSASFLQEMSLRKEVETSLASESQALADAEDANAAAKAALAREQQQRIEAERLRKQAEQALENEKAARTEADTQRGIAEKERDAARIAQRSEAQARTEADAQRTIAEQERDATSKAKDSEAKAKEFAFRSLSETFWDRGRFLAANHHTGEGMLWTVRSLATLPQNGDARLESAIRTSLTQQLRQMHKLKSCVPHNSRPSMLSPDGDYLVDNPTYAELNEADKSKRRNSFKLVDTRTGLPVKIQNEQLYAAGFIRGTKTMLVTPAYASGTTSLQMLDIERDKRLPVSFSLNSAFYYFGGARFRFTPDHKFMISGSPTAAQVWDVSKGLPVGVPQTVIPPNTLVAGISPDGKTMLIGTRRGDASLFDTATGLRLGLPVWLDEPVQNVAFTPDGKIFLTETERSLRLWDRKSGLPHEPGLEDAGRERLLTGRFVAFSNNSRFMLTLGAKARVWDLTTGKPLGRPLVHPGPVIDAAFSADDSEVITVGEKEVRRWSLASASAGSIFLTSEDEDVPQFDAAIVNPQQSHALLVSRNEVLLWDLGENKAVNRSGKAVAHPTETTWAAAEFSPDDKSVISIGKDSSVRQVSMKSGQILGPFWEVLRKQVRREVRVGPNAFDLHPDGETIFTGGRTTLGFDGRPRSEMWLESSLKTRSMKRNSGRKTVPAIVTVVRVSPDGKVTAVGAGTKVHLWKGQTYWAGLDFQHPVNDVAFSPSARELYVGGLNQVRKWSLAVSPPRSVGPTMENGGIVTHLAVGPEGTVMLAACRDRTVALWDVQLNKLRDNPYPHPSVPNFVAFHPDGDSFLIGGRGEVRRWQVVNALPETNIERLRAWAQVITGSYLDKNQEVRHLDQAEWRKRLQEYRQLGGQLEL